MSGLKRFSDGSGYSCSLSARSGVFGLHGYCFYFEDLERFFRDLRQLYHSLSGTARLQFRYEDPYIELTAVQFGHVRVHGYIVTYAPEREEFRFSFTADQTFLPPFIASVETVVRETQKT
jgi:hypothetical protein